MLERLLHAHEAWYDVERDHEFCGRTFLGYAEFHTHGEQYVLVKRAKLWEVDSHDYLFFDLEDRLTLPVLQELIEFMEQRGVEKVDAQPNHMQSLLSLVVIADEVDDDAARLVRKTRFRKNFKLGIRGWADLRLAALDLSAQAVFTNGAGKEMREALEANMRLEADSGSNQGG